MLLGAGQAGKSKRPNRSDTCTRASRQACALFGARPEVRCREYSDYWPTASDHRLVSVSSLDNDDAPPPDHIRPRVQPSWSACSPHQSRRKSCPTDFAGDQRAACTDQFVDVDGFPHRDLATSPFEEELRQLRFRMEAKLDLCLPGVIC